MNKNNKKNIIVISLIIMLCLVVTSTVFLLLYDGDKTKSITGNFPSQPLPDYSQFLPKNAIKEMFDSKGGSAYYAGAVIYYENGEYKNADTPPCFTENGELYINTEAHGKKTPQEMASALGAEYIVYDDKLVVFSYKKDFINVFSDVYTLEALALYLKGAGEEDIVNAFITLPNFITNGTTNSVYYTEPNTNLGIQTEIYSLALDGFDTGYGEVPPAPMIVAGQGEDDSNNTLVRVFNEEQACISQFLAFAPEVKGGVQVKAGYDGSNRALIATAAYDASLNAAESIKVFDTFGTLCYSFVPKGISAPYAIEVGKFLSDSNEYYIFVASLSSNGKDSKFKLYSLTDGSFVKEIAGGFDKTIKKQKIVLAASYPQGDTSKAQQIIFTFKDSGCAYALDCNDGKWNNLGLTLSENVTGIYGSAFGGDLLGSTEGEVFSNICIYGSGVSENGEDNLLNVGDMENHLYSRFAEPNPDGYLDFGEFHHIRTDLAPLGGAWNGVVANRDNLREYFDSLSYKDWKYMGFTKSMKESFHTQASLWEPCFTHRWGKTNDTINMMNYMIDGFPAYHSVGRDDNTGIYLEGASAFLIATYADAIPELAKYRIYPLRTMLQQLVVEFRGDNGDPEMLIALSPVHEHEINVPGSIGDYHPKMLEGFRQYLLSLYGSVENINKRFGTDFKTVADIDAPRFDPKIDPIVFKRGDWDVYGESDYFTQWSLYTRNIINKRVMEAYREALLAGFPPEIINAHQIPEGDAVSGFLGQADTRLSPTDVVSICGTAYGGTRYGFFINDPNNFIALAHKAGHNNITIGEYSSLSPNKDVSYKQIKYLYENGVKYISPLTDDVGVDKAEREALAQLQEENQPRSSATGGTGGIEAVYNTENPYNIIQIGDSDQNGLLKSVKKDGTWEGSVYLVPFHSRVEVTSVSLSSKSDGYRSKPVSGMQYGDQIELTFNASYSGKGNGSIKISIYHSGILMEDATAQYQLTSEETPYRYVFSNQLSLEDIEIHITYDCDDNSKVKMRHMECTLQTECAAHKYFGDFEAEANKGGVSFDVIQ